MNNVEGSNLYFKTFSEQFSKSFGMMFQRKNIIITLGFLALKYVFIFVGAFIGGMIGAILFSSGSMITGFIMIALIGIIAFIFFVLLGMLYNVCIITLTNDKEINGDGFRKNIRKNLNLYISIFIKQIKYYLLPLGLIILGYIFMALVSENALFGILSLILIVTGLIYLIITSIKLTFSFYIGIRENMEAQESIETSIKITENKKGSIFVDIFIYGLLYGCFIFSISLVIVAILGKDITGIINEVINQFYLGAFSIYVYFIYLKYLKQYMDNNNLSGNTIVIETKTMETKTEETIQESPKDF